MSCVLFASLKVAVAWRPAGRLKIGDHDDPFWTGRFDLAQQRLSAAQCLFVIRSIPAGAHAFDNCDTQSILIGSEAIDDV